MRKRWGWVFTVVFLTSSLPCFLTAFAAQVYPKGKAGAAAKPKAPWTAKQVLSALDELAAQQEQMLEQMAAIKQELAAIKVRALNRPKQVIIQ